MDRIKKAPEKIAQDKCEYGGDVGGNFVKPEQVVTAIPMGNIEHIIQDIHSILKEYYKVVRKCFVDTVCMQGTDYHFLSGDDNPLRIFSPLLVSELTDRQLKSMQERIPAGSGRERL